ncbi:hypothetical protein EVAR_8745_1 [Eumeta japonica]|uniref:Uncharacterized protein n=1 Tax=Eumeta variegata TaxID=151549 RepID=A0A4C1TTP7_EUMVA|nr:hypothetical protein EVAR_8745_1 [Eumeta japonica]
MPIFEDGNESAIENGLSFHISHKTVVPALTDDLRNFTRTAAVVPERGWRMQGCWMGSVFDFRTSPYGALLTKSIIQRAYLVAVCRSPQGAGHVGLCQNSIYSGVRQKKIGFTGFFTHRKSKVEI